MNLSWYHWAGDAMIYMDRFTGLHIRRFVSFYAQNHPKQKALETTAHVRLLDTYQLRWVIDMRAPDQQFTKGRAHLYPVPAPAEALLEKAFDDYRLASAPSWTPARFVPIDVLVDLLREGSPPFDAFVEELARTSAQPQEVS